VEKETNNCRIVFFLLGDSTASEFYVPTFRNILFHLHRLCTQTISTIKTTPVLPNPDLLKTWSYCFLTPEKHKLFFLQKTSESHLLTSFVAARVVDVSRQSKQVCGAALIPYPSLYQITCLISIRLIDLLL